MGQLTEMTRQIVYADPRILSDAEHQFMRKQENTSNESYPLLLTLDRLDCIKDIPADNAGRVLYSRLVRIRDQQRIQLLQAQKQLKAEFDRLCLKETETRDSIGILREANRIMNMKAKASARTEAMLNRELEKSAKEIKAISKDLANIRLLNDRIKQESTVERKLKALKAKKDAREQQKQLVDIQFLLKGTKDHRRSLTEAVAKATVERDNLQTQVEILEQAVVTMRFMVNDLVDTPESDEVGMEAQKAEWLPTLGTDPCVPAFLRCSLEKVRKSEFGKRQTEVFIKEIWSLKTMSDEQRRKLGLQKLTLSQFFLTYLDERAETEENKMEFSYNFVRALEKHVQDADFELFLQILFNEISEEHYYDQMTMIAHLKKSMMQMDCLDLCQDGYIHKSVFMGGLRMLFPIKKEEDFRELHRILNEQMMELNPKNNIMMVDTRKILMENAEGDQSDFMEAIRDQYFKEITDFPKDIM